MESSFITKDCNDSFSSIKREDLEHLLADYLIEYRECLGLPDFVTFGTEIEFEKVGKSFVKDFIKQNFQQDSWILKSDRTLTLGGMEINSPILKDRKEDWIELRNICYFLSSMKANTSVNAGGHIHIGANILEDNLQYWNIFFRLYALFEHVLYRFFYGDKLQARKDLCLFAKPTADFINFFLPYIEKDKSLTAAGSDIVSFLYNNDIRDIDRNYGLNLKNIQSFRPRITGLKNTLEFRSPNGTVNEVIWQNNINLIARMLLACVSGQLDMDLINYKLFRDFDKRYSYSECPSAYSEVDYRNATLLADMIFDNNLDKANFMKQYLKVSSGGTDIIDGVPVRRLTK